MVHNCIPPLEVPPQDPPVLTRIASTLGVFALIGTGLGVAAGILALRGAPQKFLNENHLIGSARRALLGLTLGGAVLGAGLGVAAFAWGRWRKRRPATEAVALADAVGRRLLPVSLVGFLPLLFQWETWVGRDLQYLLMVLVFAIAAERTFRVALDAAPIFPNLSLSRLVPNPKFAVWVVLLSCAGYVLFFSLATTRYHHYLHTSSFDLGLEENILYNFLHGGHFFKSTPLSGPTGSHFGYHAPFITYLFLPIYALSQRAETLLILQAVFMGAAAIPLFLFARKHVGPWPAALVAVGYLLYPPVHGAALYDFHYLPIGPFFLWMTLYFIEARKNLWAVLFAILAMAVREDVIPGLAILGAYLLLTGTRPVAGLVLAAAGTLAFVAIKFVIMPRFAGHTAFIHQYQGLVPTGDEGFGGVLKTVVTNPSYTLGTLLSQDKLIYVMQIMVPLVLLPFRRPLGLLFIAPGLLFTLLSTGYMPLIQISFQYTTHWTTYLFVGVVATLSRWRQGVTGGQHLRFQAALVAFVCAMIPASYQYGAVFQQNTVRGGFGPYKFSVDDADREQRRNFDALKALLPRHASVSGSENLVPQLSNRKNAYTLRVGAFDAEYLFFTLPIRSDERPAVEPDLQNGNFGVVAHRPGFALARRGHDTALNQAVLPQL